MQEEEIKKHDDDDESNDLEKEIIKKRIKESVPLP